MCFLAVQLGAVPGAPVLLAFNREEYFARPSRPPRVAAGPPPMLGGLDERAGGTWLGVNRHGLIVAVTNRLKSELPANPRSRGLLCRDLLTAASIDEAVERAVDELEQDRYAGANYILLSRRSGAVIHAGDRLEVKHLTGKLHLITNGDLDDPGDQRIHYARELFDHKSLESVPQFMATARFVCSRRARDPAEPTIVFEAEDRGTVSSTLIALADDPAKSHYLHAAGPPDRQPYDDYSQLLRDLLADG